MQLPNQPQFAGSAQLQSASTGQAVTPGQPGGMTPEPQTPTVPTGTTTLPQTNIPRRNAVSVIQKGPPRGLGTSPLFSRAASFRSKPKTNRDADSPDAAEPAAPTPSTSEKKTPPPMPERRYTMDKEGRRRNTGDPFLPATVREAWHRDNPGHMPTHTPVSPSTGPIMKDREGGGQISEDGTIVVGQSRRFTKLF